MGQPSFADHEQDHDQRAEQDPRCDIERQRAGPADERRQHEKSDHGSQPAHHVEDPVRAAAQRPGRDIRHQRVARTVEGGPGGIHEDRRREQEREAAGAGDHREKERRDRDTRQEKGNAPAELAIHPVAETGEVGLNGQRGDVVDNHHEPDQRVAGDEGPVEDGEIGVVKGRGHLAAQRYQADGGRA